MIREKMRLKIYQLDEITLQRKDEFEYTEEDRTEIEYEIDRKLHGEHIIAMDGRVFVVGVASIEADD